MIPRKLLERTQIVRRHCYKHIVAGQGNPTKFFRVSVTCGATGPYPFAGDHTVAATKPGNLMNLNLWKSAVVGGVLLSGLAATTAGTLQTRDVAGNCAWVIHLDCDALKKTEFGKFGDVLDKVHRKLGEAQNVVEAASTRRRAVDRKLKSVEALPEAAAQSLLAITADDLLEEIVDEEAAE